MANERLPPPASSVLNLLPWLLDENSWSMEVRSGEPSSPHDRGVWPLGNGMVFGHAGLGSPVHKLKGLVGPYYQTEGDHSVQGAFGDCWWEMWGQDEALVPSYEFVYRPRRSGALVTKSEFGSHVLVTVDVAPPDMPVIIRIAELWTQKGAEENLRLKFIMPRADPIDGRSLLGTTYRDGQAMVAGVKGNLGDVVSGGINLPVAAVERGETMFRVHVVLAASENIIAASRLFDDTDDPLGLLERDRKWWEHWLAGTKTPVVVGSKKFDRTRIENLIEIGKVNLKMQQCKESGAVSPMVHFKGVWARDSNGPVRAFLGMGAFDEAMSILEYYYSASIVTGRIANSHPLDLPVKDVNEGVEWNDVEVEALEVPSHLVLQHRWWIEAGGDVELVDRHWEYLRRCVDGQEQDSNGLQGFHGDETYLLGSLYSILDGRVSAPHDLIDFSDGENVFWSLDSSVLLCSALEAMAWMCPMVSRAQEANAFQMRADEIREAVERIFWQEELGWYAPAVNRKTGKPHENPFAPINLRGLWVGFHRPQSQRAQKNVEAVLNRVGLTGVTPACGYNVGTTPAYLLSNLVAIDSPRAEEAFDSLVSMASPAGEWSEVYAPGGRPTGGYSDENPNRVRPWEGGLALDAIYRYLNSKSR